MQTNTLTKLLGTGLLLASGLVHAAHYHIDVAIDPTLYATLNVPLFLDFQLNSGGGASPTDNAVTVEHFHFTNGTPTTGTVTSSGLASGDLNSSVGLAVDAGNPYSEFFQAFSNGTSSIGFDVTTTSNLNTDVADLFTVAILDSALGNLQVPTTAPDGVSLFALPLGEVELGTAYASTDSATGITTTAVPSPATLWLFAPGLAALLRFKRHTSRKLRLGDLRPIVSKTMRVEILIAPKRHCRCADSIIRGAFAKRQNAPTRNSPAAQNNRAADAFPASRRLIRLCKRTN
jgi:hypothetical protein